MRRLTRREEYARLDSEQAHVTAMVLQAVLHFPETVYTIRGKQGYTARVIAPESPTGGYLALTWAPSGQRPSTACYYLEAWLAAESERSRVYSLANPEHAALVELVGRIKSLRLAVLDKKGD